MKKLLIYIAAIATIAACSTAPSYKISGDIAGQEGTIYLTHVVDGKWVKADSTELADGKFTFEGSVKGSEQYFLTFKNNKRARIPFIIENSAININADISNLKLMEITGSASQDVMKSYAEIIKPFNEKKGELNQTYSEANQAKDEKKKEEIIADYNEVQKEVAVATKKFIKENNKTYAAAVIASQSIQAKEADEIDELIALLDASLMENDLVIGMKEKADALRNVAIGKIAPDFTLNDAEGNPIKLSSLLGEGYLLVDFWASWCVPCRRENPNVVAVYKEFHDKGFEVIGISLDRAKAEAWEKAIIDDNLPWTNVLDYTNEKAEVAKTYAVSSIPTNFLLDKEGLIIAKNLRGKALEEKLAELLE